MRIECRCLWAWRGRCCRWRWLRDSECSTARVSERNQIHTDTVVCSPSEASTILCNQILLCRYWRHLSYYIKQVK